MSFLNQFLFLYAIFDKSCLIWVRKKARSETKWCFCSGGSQEVQTEAWRAKKKFWETAPPPPPSLSKGLDDLALCYIYRELTLQSSRMTFESGLSFHTFNVWETISNICFKKCFVWRKYEQRWVQYHLECTRAQAGLNVSEVIRN